MELEEQTAQAEVVDIERFGNLLRIGVIDIPTMWSLKAMRNGDKFRSTTRDVKRLLGELQTENVDGIVIDLRDNGGGSLQEAKTLLAFLSIEAPPFKFEAKRIGLMS